MPWPRRAGLRLLGAAARPRPGALPELRKAAAPAAGRDAALRGGSALGQGCGGHLYLPRDHSEGARSEEHPAARRLITVRGGEKLEGAAGRTADARYAGAA